MTISNPTFYQSPASGEPFSRAWNIFTRLIGWAPIVVGLIFLYYGSGKALNLSPTILSIRFLVIKTLVAKALAVMVAAVDLYLALSLLLSHEKRRPVIATLCCLAVYSCFLGYLASMRNPPNCGCGGMMKFFVSNRANAAVGLARNVGLMSYLGAYWYFKLVKRQ